MKKRGKNQEVPDERHETIRRAIMALLEDGSHSARDISAEVGISEKEVEGHLEHIRKSMRNSERVLAITPAECRKCGFLFSKTERLKKPGKCPVCRSESIFEPLFGVERQGE